MQHRFGIKARFISLILALLVTLFLVIVIVLVHRNTVSMRNELADRSKAFAALATSPIGNTYLDYKDSGTVLISQQIQKFRDLDTNVKNVSIVDDKGEVAYSQLPQAGKVSATDAQSFDPIYSYNSAHTITRVVYPFVQSGGVHRYGIVYDISSASVDTEISRLVKSILLYSTIGLVFSAIITYLLVNRLFLRPIRQLRDKALVISAGHYSEQIPHDRKDEIGDLALSVNQMADRLKLDIQKLKEVDQIKSEFMMIASHNLRTPLTIIEGYIDMAKSQALSEELRTMIESIEVNSQRLGIFAEDLLTIASIESGQKVITTKPLDIKSLLQTITKDFAGLTKEKNITFDCSLPEEKIEILGSNPHLRSAIWNILDNSLKFTEAGGTIGLTLQKVDDNVHISIKDTGIGIAPEEIDKLFTKFHRGTSTINYNYEGTGIGLYVTKLIITEHGGTITVDSVLDKGSTFTILLPLVTTI